MADLYLTPAERYTAALGGFYYGDLPEPGTVYTQLIKDILDGATPDKEPKNILARFIYSLYISDLGDPYPRYELAKLLYWKLHDMTPTKSGSILTVTIDGEEDYMTINTDLSRLWYKVLFGSKTDVITEFPYIFNTMQNKLSDWELFGNAEVSGTPSPQNPVMPQGTGERTGNLFDGTVSGTNKRIAISTGGSYNSNGYSISEYIPIDGNTNYIINTTYSSYFAIYDSNKNYIYGEEIKTTKPIPATYTNARFVRFDFKTVDKDSIMFNKGLQSLPYEPYGIKIPISSANTTTPVYLGEVETTRKIKKLVLTGDRTYDYRKNNTDESNYLYYIRMSDDSVGARICTCSHLPFNASGAPTDSVGCNANAPRIIYINFGADIMNAQTSGNTVAGLKEYLTAQYAAGTPVTVWYVLATPETAVVNEPLMKIGGYADSLSRTQTGIDIPTIIGQNALDVLTTVKPSSMRVEYTSADETRSRSKRISLLKSPLKKGLIK